MAQRGVIVTVTLVATGALLVQVIAVRPCLTWRSDAVLADVRQAVNWRQRISVYVGLKSPKVALLVGGILLLSA